MTLGIMVFIILRWRLLCRSDWKICFIERHV